MIRFKTFPSVRSRRHASWLAAASLTLGLVALHAAKNPDKPEKPDKPDKPARVDKIERKLERAAEAELLSPATPRPVTAATSREGATSSGRTSKSDRPEPSENRSSASSPADPKFETFRVVLERNIFNPNRAPRGRVAPEEKPPRVDEISLVGTMQSEKGLLAFFDSADSEFRKNLREGDSIAGFTVRRIAADGVELLRDEQPIALKVAQQLRRPEGGDWTVNAASPDAEMRAASSPEGARSAAAAAATEIPANASEVLKRLMQQRQKQSK
jgi:hypothetical protein